MTRPKKILAVCALAFAAAGASTAPALAGDHSSAGTDDRVQTISILERNTTILPATTGAPTLNTGSATAS
ncbi:hypothetical protein ACQEU8_33710 [Streptomyces sp. CA-250714]|uniref:hypothetical protein n=1 Tax=Streptomyces sp. CA-250714 TaxID=3240060 RepID=UPI003D90BAE2